MADIVERARNYVGLNAAESGADVLILDMADEIERLQAAKRRALAIADERNKEGAALRAEIERLRTALDKIATYGEDYHGYVNAVIDGKPVSRFARAALNIQGGKSDG